MNLSERIQKSQEFRTKLYNKCWEDEAFKQELMTDPVAALSKIGVTLNPDLNVVINDQTDGATININIPPKPSFDNMELSEKELEMVAGGQAASGWFDFDFDFSSIGICIDIL